MPYTSIEYELFLSVYVGDIKRVATKAWLRCGQHLREKIEHSTCRSSRCGMQWKSSQQSTKKRSYQKLRRFTELPRHMLKNFQPKKSHNTHKVSSWCYDMTSHAEERVERFWNLAKKSVLQLTEAETPCTDDHQLKNHDFGNGRWVVSCLRKERFFDRIVPGQDERDGEECRVEGRRVSDQTRNQTHDDMTWCAQDTMSQCHVRHWNECM